MTQRLAPWLEGKYGWEFGESGWNSGMDENLLKFSYMFDRNIDGIVDTLPPPLDGRAYYLTTDNRVYYVARGVYNTCQVPKWFSLIIRDTGEIYQFNGVQLVHIDKVSQLRNELDTIDGVIASLGTAAYQDTADFLLSEDLIASEGEIQGASLIGFDGVTLDQQIKERILRVVDSISSLRLLDKSLYTRVFVSGYYTAGDGGGGDYFLDPTDTTSVDNGGTTIVSSDGGRWKLSRAGEVSVKQFGAKATGAGGNNTDADLNSERIQACLDYCSAMGSIAYIPQGEYAISSTITLFENISAQEPFGGSTKCGIRGDGPGLSVIRWTGGAGAALSIIGEVTSLQTVKGIGMLGAGFLGTGVYLKDLAWFHMEDVMVTGFEYGIDAYNTLSSKFDTLTLRGNKYGGRFQRVEGIFSSQPNAITMINCEIGLNSEWGLLVLKPGVFNVIGGAVQGNGVTGVATERWGIRAIDGGAEGASGINIIGVYFEANVGLADLFIEQFSYSAPSSVVGCGFTRIAGEYTTNCIRFDNDPSVSSSLTLTGTGFLSGVGYVPAAGRKYLLVQNPTQNFTLTEFGSTYSSDVEVHDLPGRHVTPRTTLAAAAAYSGTLVAPIRYINVQSVTRVGVGVYTLTFATPMESNSYIVNSCLEGAAGFCFVTNETTGGFTVNTLNSMGSPADFRWAVQVFG